MHNKPHLDDLAPHARGNRQFPASDWFRDPILVALVVPTLSLVSLARRRPRSWRLRPNLAVVEQGGQQRQNVCNA